MMSNNQIYWTSFKIEQKPVTAKDIIHEEPEEEEELELEIEKSEKDSSQIDASPTNTEEPAKEFTESEKLMQSEKEFQ